MSVFNKFKIGNTTYDVGAKGENIENGGNIINTFSQASSRANIVSGEEASVIFGKIMKYFADLKEPAFKNLVENYETTVKGKPLDAIVAHMLKEYIDEKLAQLNSKIENFSPARLREALKYSGLITSESMTYDQILAALMAYWPERYYILNYDYRNDDITWNSAPIFDKDYNCYYCKREGSIDVLCDFSMDIKNYNKFVSKCHFLPKSNNAGVSIYDLINKQYLYNSGVITAAGDMLISVDIPQNTNNQIRFNYSISSAGSSNTNAYLYIYEAYLM